MYKSIYEKDRIWKMLFVTYSEGAIYKLYEDDAKGGMAALNALTNLYSKAGLVNHISIDDVGTQKSNIAAHYGKELNPCDYIIQERNPGFCKTHGELKTHMTTNLDDEKLKEWLGERAHSRTREMHNIIEITGKDYRK